MPLRPRILCALGALLFSTAAALAQPATLPLAGEWRFALDRTDSGVNELWFTRDLADRIKLPGILQAQGYGDEIGTGTPWVVTLYDRSWFLREEYKAYTSPGKVKVPFLSQPPRHYLGAAWYQRDVDIPAGWQGRRIALYLERARWESTVWVDDRRIGSANSLVAPHEFELGSLSPGRHRLTVRLDNRMILPYRADGHSVSDALGATWNGIVGRIELTATTPVWIDDAQVYPDVATRSVLIKATLGNATGRAGAGTLSAGGVSAPVAWTAEGGTTELRVPLGADAQLWDEFNPVLHHLTLALDGGGADDRRELTFGLRDFRTAGAEFTVNGRLTHLRGTHHGGDFALTGHPPTDVAYWRALFLTCRAWGLNHMRFHSFCPPEAAFAAADEVGFYLQPECGMWNSFTAGGDIDRMVEAETARIVRAYGNHPSFVMLSPTNEPAGNWTGCLPQWTARWAAREPRRLFTVNTGRVTPATATTSHYLTLSSYGNGRLRGNSAWFGGDYRAALTGVTVPVVTHELGQWCAYPDFDIIAKFTGYLRPGNYEIFRDSAAAHGLLARNKELARASGRFQLACYKEEIEANLRTPGLGGFQLLDLHDYAGQGTALVGVLDMFWQSKGYATPEEWRRFCGPTVPLARLKRRVFTTADAFAVDVELAHYGAAPLTGVAGTWRIVDDSGAVAAQGRWPAADFALGRSHPLGRVTADLAQLPAPRAYKLVVGLEGTAVENDWNFWLYPAQVATAAPDGVLVTRSWSGAEARLAAGGRVLFLPLPANLGWTSPLLEDVPVFWNRQMNPNWSRMLGLWCDRSHPALAGFPTGEACDWQWTEFVRTTRAVNLDGMPRTLQPIVQAIDDWNRNWKLGLVFECRVGQGRLLVCSVDLVSDLDRRPVARQLRRSLLDYAGGDKFAPAVAVTPDEARGLWFDSRLMGRLGAKAQGTDTGAAAAIDGDPSTPWQAGGFGRFGGRRGTPPGTAPAGGAPNSTGGTPLGAPPAGAQVPGQGGPSAATAASGPVGPAPEAGQRPDRGGQSGDSSQPRALHIAFPSPVAMNGLALFPRQNDREHRGDIRGYLVRVSDDGTQWREVARGELGSTYNPQQIRFAGTVTASHLEFTALSGFGDDSGGSLAELTVLYAGPALPDDAGTVEYQRVRSTTTDVEEPTGPAPAPSADAARPPRQNE